MLIADLDQYRGAGERSKSGRLVMISASGWGIKLLDGGGSEVIGVGTGGPPAVLLASDKRHLSEASTAKLTEEQAFGLTTLLEPGSLSRTFD